MTNLLRASLLAIIVSFLASVTPAQERSPNLSQTQMKAILKSYFDSMNAHETQKLISLFAPDGFIEDPIGAPLQTPTQFFTRIAPIPLMFEVVEMTATNANTAAVALHINGVKMGNVTRGVLSAIEIFTFKPDGSIAGMKAYWGRDDLRS